MLKPHETFPQQQARECDLDRRRFLCAAGGAVTLALTGEWAARQLEARWRETPLDVSLDRGALPEVGEARVTLAAKGQEALVVRVDQNTLVSFDRRCPHLGCPILWVAARGRFECPCHRAAFDAQTGAVLFGPPRHGLKRARLRVAGGSAVRS
jgi:Rieske Fe-S protein